MLPIRHILPCLLLSGLACNASHATTILLTAPYYFNHDTDEVICSVSNKKTSVTPLAIHIESLDMLGNVVDSYHANLGPNGGDFMPASATAAICRFTFSAAPSAVVAGAWYAKSGALQTFVPAK